MSGSAPLQPTLWRTCRVLANRTRLRIFQELLKEPGQSVTSLAGRLKLPLPVASLYLRALEARGFLTVHRAKGRVYYRPAGETAGVTRELVNTVRQIFKSEQLPVETAFKLATAFTHPRRIEIFRALNSRPSTFGELQATVRISRRALSRHLAKLVARGFVAQEDKHYGVVTPSHSFRRELARMAIS